MCPGAGQRPLPGPTSIRLRLDIQHAAWFQSFLPGPTSIRLRLDPPKTAKFSLLEVDNASAEPNVNKTTTDNNNFFIFFSFLLF